MQIVKPTPDSSAKQGDAIDTGSIIKLQHMKTRKWLHSHLHASPLSGNLEVSLISIAHSVNLIEITKIRLYFFLIFCGPIHLR
jgi:dolichyl-phosphate-mannose--protein O-mannosyl transferase